MICLKSHSKQDWNLVQVKGIMHPFHLNGAFQTTAGNEIKIIIVSLLNACLEHLLPESRNMGMLSIPLSLSLNGPKMKKIEDCINIQVRIVSINSWGRRTKLFKGIDYFLFYLYPQGLV